MATRVLKRVPDRRQGLPAVQSPPPRACTPQSAMAPLPSLKGAELLKHKELTSAVPCSKLPNASQSRNSSNVILPKADGTKHEVLSQLATTKLEGPWSGTHARQGGCRPPARRLSLHRADGQQHSFGRCTRVPCRLSRRADSLRQTPPVPDTASPGSTSSFSLTESLRVEGGHWPPFRGEKRGSETKRESTGSKAEWTRPDQPSQQASHLRSQAVRALRDTLPTRRPL